MLYALGHWEMAQDRLEEGVKMAKEFTVIIEQDEEGYYIAEVPELKGCHTQAKSLDTLMERIKEAIQPIPLSGKEE